ncbi:hypothetical protein FNV43_RR21962 [Rhamnella rubrinervis]|uniref:Uncharacterized protein n=1 Tax=Rhamnella rubrinervis TaxID=2594499 RepID=A0A8K0GUQ4_9ROSA|nr:hypothetical protein FNV43_RR21962 [Rhamnella rubrinervis]
MIAPPPQIGPSEASSADMRVLLPTTVARSSLHLLPPAPPTEFLLYQYRAKVTREYYQHYGSVTETFSNALCCRGKIKHPSDIRPSFHLPRFHPTSPFSVILRLRSSLRSDSNLLAFKGFSNPYLIPTMESPGSDLAVEEQLYRARATYAEQLAILVRTHRPIEEVRPTNRHGHFFIESTLHLCASNLVKGSGSPQQKNVIRHSSTKTKSLRLYFPKTPSAAHRLAVRNFPARSRKRNLEEEDLLPNRPRNSRVSSSYTQVRLHILEGDDPHEVGLEDEQNALKVTPDPNDDEEDGGQEDMEITSGEDEPDEGDAPPVNQPELPGLNAEPNDSFEEAMRLPSNEESGPGQTSRLTNTARD